MILHHLFWSKTRSSGSWRIKDKSSLTGSFKCSRAVNGTWMVDILKSGQVFYIFSTNSFIGKFSACYAHVTMIYMEFIGFGCLPIKCTILILFQPALLWSFSSKVRYISYVSFKQGSKLLYYLMLLYWSQENSDDCRNEKLSNSSG